MNLETLFAPISRLVFLVETKCNSRHIDHIKRRLDLFTFGVDSRGRSGGLALLWDKSVNAIIQSLSQPHNVGMQTNRIWMKFIGNKGEGRLASRRRQEHKIFSLTKASERKRTNTISRLKDDWGNFWDQPEGIKRLILEYFSNLFTSDHPSGVDIDQGIEHIEPRVDQDLAAELSRPYTEDEPRDFNATNIVLIPKCKKLESLTQVWPISLCNVAYKIASKSIANKLKPFLDSMISPLQAAFIPTRLITDNALIAFELNHFLSTRTKGKKDFMALKLDISNAYDKVEWLFMKKVMIKLGFPLSFVNLVMTCVSTVSYSFIVNGHQFGSIIPQRGLTKETPSPYLSCCVQKL
ncbi:UNVERIFIED_CONTAM: hypothetical protein Scaly_1912700 [Sesamum calycinum]|uniref:Reverse transcriptase domain-containing protein n=1 Tax=Sesamum calycinum TaxID=2727403 RepID=A0AAW2NJ48_9LAMI